MTTPAGTPAAFRPDIRVVRVAPGIDTKEYAAAVVTAFAPHLSDEEVGRRADAMLVPGPPSADRGTTLQGLPPDVATRLDALGQLVDTTARSVFAAVPDPLLSSTVTVLEPGDGTSGERTVVWMRQGRDGELRFLLPGLAVDLSQASFRQVELVQETPATTRPARSDMAMDAVATPMAMATTNSSALVKTIAEDITQVASSVSWALPPPWNVGITAALSIVEMLLHATDKPQVSPMVQLKKDLELYLQESKLTTGLQDTRDFTDNLLINTAKFTYAPEDLPANGDSSFEKWWAGAEGIDPLDNTVNQIISDLEKFTSTDGAGDQLAAACSTLTAWTSGQKIWMQYNAMKVAAQMRNGDVAAYATGQYADGASDANWRDTFDKIQHRLFGLQDPDDPSVTEVEGLATRIGTWIQGCRDDRMGKLHVVKRTSQRGATQTSPYGSCAGPDIWGWRFVDDADDDEWAHFFPDTQVQVDMCHMKNVEHKDKADLAFTDHENALTSALDAATGEAAKTIAALQDRIQEIAQLMPPAAPKDRPTITLTTVGTATPIADGLWVKGALVSYQVAFANDSKLGVPGPETTPTAIGDFAGATLTGIPQDPHADYIHILRTVRLTPEAKPIVRKLQPVPMGTVRVDDLPGK